MTRDEKIKQIRQRAKKNFSRGYNCAECVLEAIISHIDTGLQKEVLRLATGFGGGVGIYGDTCGAVTGAVMAVGAVYGRSGLPGGEGRPAVKEAVNQMYGRPGLYRLFNQIPNRLKEKHGHTLCRELTVKWKDAWFCKEQALSCRDLVMDAAGIAAELILSDKEEICSKPFGENVENLKDGESCCGSGG